jgi:hypothetical protein
VYKQKSLTGEATLPSPQVIGVPGITRAYLLDLPMLRDEDVGIGIYSAMNGFSTAWPGASLMKSSDGGASYVSMYSSPREAFTGKTVNVLGDWHNGNMFDETNLLVVRMERGQVYSTTMDAVLNGANAAALQSGSGWEIIQFRTARLNTDGDYVLSGFLRGRKGTEWAIPGHAANDTFVMLTSAAIARVTLPSGEIGVERLFKAVTFESLISDAAEIPFTNTSVSRKCYAPVLLGAGKDGSNNIALKWFRRARYGGAWHNLVDTPLSETTELYDVEIWDSTFTTLKRTFSSLTAPTVSYTSAQQVTDFGSNQSIVYVKVFQLSDTTGRGYAAKGTLHV